MENDKLVIYRIISLVVIGVVFELTFACLFLVVSTS